MVFGCTCGSGVAERSTGGSLRNINPAAKLVNENRPRSVSDSSPSTARQPDQKKRVSFAQRVLERIPSTHRAGPPPAAKTTSNEQRRRKVAPLAHTRPTDSQGSTGTGPQYSYGTASVPVVPYRGMGRNILPTAQEWRLLSERAAAEQRRRRDTAPVFDFGETTASDSWRSARTPSMNSNDDLYRVNTPITDTSLRSGQQSNSSNDRNMFATAGIHIENEMREDTLRGHSMPPDAMTTVANMLFAKPATPSDPVQNRPSMYEVYSTPNYLPTGARSIPPPPSSTTPSNQIPSSLLAGFGMGYDNFYTSVDRPANPTPNEDTFSLLDGRSVDIAPSSHAPSASLPFEYVFNDMGSAAGGYSMDYGSLDGLIVSGVARKTEIAEREERERRRQKAMEANGNDEGAIRPYNPNVPRSVAGASDVNAGSLLDEFSPAHVPQAAGNKPRQKHVSYYNTVRKERQFFLLNLELERAKRNRELEEQASRAVPTTTTTTTASTPTGMFASSPLRTTSNQPPSPPTQRKVNVALRTSTLPPIVPAPPSISKTVEPVATQVAANVISSNPFESFDFYAFNSNDYDALMTTASLEPAQNIPKTEVPTLSPVEPGKRNAWVDTSNKLTVQDSGDWEDCLGFDAVMKMSKGTTKPSEAKRVENLSPSAVQRTSPAVAEAVAESPEASPEEMAEYTGIMNAARAALREPQPPVHTVLKKPAPPTRAPANAARNKVENGKNKKTPAKVLDFFEELNDEQKKKLFGTSPEKDNDGSSEDTGSEDGPESTSDYSFSDDEDEEDRNNVSRRGHRNGNTHSSGRKPSRPGTQSHPPMKQLLQRIHRVDSGKFKNSPDGLTDSSLDAFRRNGLKGAKSKNSGEELASSSGGGSNSTKTRNGDGPPAPPQNDPSQPLVSILSRSGSALLKKTTSLKSFSSAVSSSRSSSRSNSRPNSASIRKSRRDRSVSFAEDVETVIKTSARKSR